MPRERLEAWVLQLANEASSVDPMETGEVIRALTGGFEVFCPQAHSSERLHRAAAAFLRIARMS